MIHAAFVVFKLKAFDEPGSRSIS